MILESGKLSNVFPCQNPFVITVYHQDQFPKGNGQLRPSVPRQQRFGGDMDPSAPRRMYHGQFVPGFPAHPHRGFETVTAVLRGTVDHTDGLGSRGRYGNGDVQWMTAGRGLQHCEMFPLLDTEEENPLELFQIWLSLAGDRRMVEPDYRMLWNETIPKLKFRDDEERSIKITLIAGRVGDVSAPPATRDSWASDPASQLSIQIIELAQGARWEIPAGPQGLNRSLYYYDGESVEIAERRFSESSYAFLSGSKATLLENSGSVTARILLLEAVPVEGPIVAQGPFVMSSTAEIRQAYADYQQTQFGGWPFSSPEICHAPEQVRFAEYPDGRIEYPDVGSVGSL